jgi:hypothetical protein
MHHDVGAVLEGTAKAGCRHGVVHDERNTVPVGDVGQFLEIRDVAERVAHRFAVERLRAAVNQSLEGLRIAVVREAHVDAVLRQGMGKKIVGAAVERARGDDVVARFADGQDRVGDRRLARGQREAGDATLHRRDALLQHVLGGVHDAGVDVPLHLEVEQIRAVLRVVEGVRGRLVNGHRRRFGRGLGAVAGVDGERFDFHLIHPRSGWVGG